MSKVSEQEVKNMARLAKITLTNQEINLIKKQLTDVLNFVGQLKKVNTENIEPTSQTTSLENVLREDEVKPESFTSTNALSGTNSTHNDYFKVERILKEK